MTLITKNDMKWCRKNVPIGTVPYVNFCDKCRFGDYGMKDRDSVCYAIYNYVVRRKHTIGITIYDK